MEPDEYNLHKRVEKRVEKLIYRQVDRQLERGESFDGDYPEMLDDASAFISDADLWMVVAVIEDGPLDYDMLTSKYLPRAGGFEDGIRAFAAAQLKHIAADHLHVLEDG